MSRNAEFTSSHHLFQLLEVPNLSHLKSVSGMKNALSVQDAQPHWWAKDSSPSRMWSFAMNVVLCSSVESYEDALFSLYNHVFCYSAVRKSSKRCIAYLVIQMTFQQQFNSITVLNCLL